VKILVDCRGLSGNPPKHDRQEFGKYAVSLRFEALMAGRISGYEVAFLAHPPVMDPNRLALQEARSRGLKSMVFEKDENALTWLGVKPAPD
jgi:hypothetical protein